ncbi:glutathione synthase [Lujinxingia litoralis]|uniref:Glutathione synthetase n=1 Tax=Lujinxingia litoralis TaxID=2211119 RepID=A0A328C3A4_9DELT|nr:glutathione synthase [Lujinxingia litoralis]RAL20281.1 glutathione synthase [Lujinxingia litoralis]
MKIAYVMDPLTRVNVFADTTFALMLGAQQRGHDIFYVRPESLEARGDEAFAMLQPVTLRQDPVDPVSYGEARQASLDEMDVVWMRKDPPFDDTYMYEVMLLELAEERGTLVLNRPRGLRDANEKLYALHFSDHTPRTLVSSQAESIKAFAEEVGGKAVLKPLDGHGGAGIFVIGSEDRNLNAMIEVSTHGGTRRVMVQQYLPEARQGDKRVLMLDGKPMGAILRVPLEQEHRSNIHVGGRVEKTELTEREQAICEAVGPRLKADGLTFVGLDMIGERLTEVNVTSPTGIQEMSRLNGVDGPAEVMAWIENELG